LKADNILLLVSTWWYFSPYLTLSYETQHWMLYWLQYSLHEHRRWRTHLSPHKWKNAKCYYCHTYS